MKKKKNYFGRSKNADTYTRKQISKYSAMRIDTYRLRLNTFLREKGVSQVSNLLN